MVPQKRTATLNTRLRDGKPWFVAGPTGQVPPTKTGQEISLPRCHFIRLMSLHPRGVHRFFQYIHRLGEMGVRDGDRG